MLAPYLSVNSFSFGTERNGKDIISVIDKSLIVILVFTISIFISVGFSDVG